MEAVATSIPLTYPHCAGCLRGSDEPHLVTPGVYHAASKKPQESGVSHHLITLEDGVWRCNCKSFEYRERCTHSGWVGTLDVQRRSRETGVSIAKLAGITLESLFE